MIVNKKILALLITCTASLVHGADTFVKISVDPICLSVESDRILAYVDRKTVSLHDNFGRIINKIPPSGIFEIDLGDNFEHRVHLERIDSSGRRIKITTERRLVAGETNLAEFSTELYLAPESKLSTINSSDNNQSSLGNNDVADSGSEQLIMTFVIMVSGAFLFYYYQKKKRVNKIIKEPIMIERDQVQPDALSWPEQMNLRYPHLRPLQKVKSGGAGTIFLVQNSRSQNRLGAVKILHYEYAKNYNADSNRFLSEPKVLSRLSDLKVAPQLYSVTFDNPGSDAVLWYEMEWLESYITLRKYVGGKGKKVQLTQFYKIFTLLFHHTKSMHLRGVVHRDLTPENIMVDVNLDNLRIVDFGLVRFTRGLSGDDLIAFSEIDNIKEVIGKPSYCAPEQWIDGLNSATEAADWYAIGSIAWELLMGVTPYRRPEEVRLNSRSSQSLYEDLTQNTGVSQDVAFCIAGLLSSNVSARLDAVQNFKVN